MRDTPSGDGPIQTLDRVLRRGVNHSEPALCGICVAGILAEAGERLLFWKGTARPPPLHEAFESAHR